MIAAIEIYNKPDFKYREETFALLTLNAWELFLKGKVLEEKQNDIRSIYETETHRNKDGTQSKKRYFKKNRSGTAATISLGKAIVTLDANASSRLDPALKANLDALVEIRDNASHFINAGPELAKQVLEIGTAAVRNYITLMKNWFKRDLSQYNLFLMPIGFVGPSSATGLSVTSDERKLIAFLTKIAQENVDAPDTDYHVALKVNLSFQRSKINPTAQVFITDDPSAPHVNVSEEDILKAYPWDYKELTTRLSKKYIDFKADSKYHGIRKSLLTDARYVKTRLLDPGNPKSSRKHFYNPNIIQIFDQNYTTKS